MPDPTRNAPTHPRLALRPREAAAALGVSERHLFTLAKSGVIPSVRVGRCRVFPVEALQLWLADATEGRAAR